MKSQESAKSYLLLQLWIKQKIPSTSSSSRDARKGWFDTVDPKRLVNELLI